MNELFTDLFLCMPAGIAVLIFMCTVGGWGLKRRNVRGSPQ